MACERVACYRNDRVPLVYEFYAAQFGNPLRNCGSFIYRCKEITHSKQT